MKKKGEKLIYDDTYRRNSHRYRKRLDVQIEKGIKIPRPVKPTMYPFQEMEVGDSFLIQNDHKLALAAKACMDKRQNIDGTEFASRLVRDANGNYIGVRFWRVK